MAKLRDVRDAYGRLGHELGPNQLAQLLEDKPAQELTYFARELRDRDRGPIAEGTYRALLLPMRETELECRTLPRGPHVVVGMLMAPALSSAPPLGPSPSQSLVDAWNNQVVAGFSSLAHRYPFASVPDEVSPSELAAYFGPQGSFWMFYQSQLASTIGPDGSTILNPEAAAHVPPAWKSLIHQANLIRSALFPNNSPEIYFRLRATTDQGTYPPVEPPAQSIPAQQTLTVNGATFVYQGGPGLDQVMEWRPSALQPSAQLQAPGLGTLMQTGAWALFRLSDSGTHQRHGNAERVTWALAKPGGGRVFLVYDLALEVNGATYEMDPFRATFFRSFKPQAYSLH